MSLQRPAGTLGSFWGNLGCDLVTLGRRKWIAGIATAEERRAWFSMFQAQSPQGKHGPLRPDLPLSPANDSFRV